MASLQIKNVPDDLLAEVKRRAAQRHLTLRDYLLELIALDQRAPTLDDWLATLEGRPVVDLRPTATRDAIDGARDDRDAELRASADDR